MDAVSFSPDKLDQCYRAVSGSQRGNLELVRIGNNRNNRILDRDLYFFWTTFFT